MKINIHNNKKKKSTEYAWDQWRSRQKKKNKNDTHTETETKTETETSSQIQRRRKIWQQHDKYVVNQSLAASSSKKVWEREKTIAEEFTALI